MSLVLHNSNWRKTTEFPHSTGTLSVHPNACMSHTGKSTIGVWHSMYTQLHPCSVMDDGGTNTSTSQSALQRHQPCCVHDMCTDPEASLRQLLQLRCNLIEGMRLKHYRRRCTFHMGIASWSWRVVVNDSSGHVPHHVAHVAGHMAGEPTRPITDNRQLICTKLCVRLLDRSI